MNFDQMATSLASIAKIGEMLTVINNLIGQIETEQNEVLESDVQLESLAKIKEEFEGERKSHAEELRQINQDINTLEDCVKMVKNEREVKKLRITQLVQALGNSRLNANNTLKNVSIDEQFEEMTQESDWKTLGIPEASLPNGNLQLYDFLRMAQQCKPSSSSNSEPPKTKSCESCNAQIHRNAPTCPICKTKSRSKNPKRRRKAENKNQ